MEKPITCPVLIGRIRERAALHTLVDTVKSGQGRVALISGEAGIGKSRLIAEAKTYAAAQGFLLLQGHCYPTDTSCPYAPLLDLLRSFLAHPSTAEVATDLKLFAPTLVPLLPDLVFLLPDSAPALQLASLEPEQEKRRLFETMTQFFTRQALKQPVLLIVEDLHWSDDTSLDYLHYLARRCAAHPLLVLLTYRSDEVRPRLRQWLAEFDRERLAQELALSPLTRSHMDAMLRAIFDVRRPIHAEALEALYTLTEGNPFFIEEVLSSLIARGVILDAQGAWDRKLMREFNVPRSIQSAVQQRTERLSPAARELLALAAVAGQRFDFALLQQVLKRDEQVLLQLIKELIAAQMVVEASADQFAFRHELTRQAISAELLARERKALHRTIAEAIEHLSTPTQDAHLADLAYHFYEGGVWAKALEYEQRAGERAQSLYAPRAAIEHLTHALDAAHQMHVTQPAQIYYTRGQAYATLGEFDRACSDYEHSLEAAHTAQNSHMEWQSMMALGFLWAGRNYTQSGEWFRQASGLAERLADPILRARSLNRLANWLANTGQAEEGLQAHQQALNIFEEQQDTQGMAETFDLLAMTYGMRGDRVKAVEQLGQAIPLFRSLGNTQSLASSLTMRTIQSISMVSETTFHAFRTYDECMQDATEALRLAQQMDSLPGQSFAERTIAGVFSSFGQLSPALTHTQEALRIATEIEHQEWIVAAYYNLGHIYLQMLAHTLALQALEIGLSLAWKLNSALWIHYLIADQALAYVLTQELPRAEAALKAIMQREQRPRVMPERHVARAWAELTLAQGEPGIALQIAEHLLESAPGRVPGQSPQPIPHLLKVKGEALVALKGLDEATQVLEAAKQGALERQDPAVLWAVHRSLGRVYQHLRRGEQARGEFAAARQLIGELATTIDDASLREQFLQTALGSLPQETSLPLREAAKLAFGGLTAREREVAALIAQGKTSREIAELLVVSERTAEVHVSNILGKLGFTSRAQIAVWAVEKGLAKH